MSEVICEFCNSTLSSKYILKTHLLNNKACLEIRNIDIKYQFLCKGCNNHYSCSQKLSVHQDKCMDFQKLEIEETHKKEKKEYIEEKEAEIINIRSLYQTEKEKYMTEKEKQIKDLEMAFAKEQEHKDEKCF